MKLFLKGLGICGWGQWNRISQDFVKSRDRVQVASHAYKYLKRKRIEGRNDNLWKMRIETLIS